MWRGNMKYQDIVSPRSRLDSVTQSGFEETNQQQHNSSNDHLSHDSLTFLMNPGHWTFMINMKIRLGTRGN